MCYQMEGLDKFDQAQNGGRRQQGGIVREFSVCCGGAFHQQFANGNTLADAMVRFKY
ncbi:MAG: hypothetical protein WBN22_11925 [Verrucomicrobiia bacterium]